MSLVYRNDGAEPTRSSTVKDSLTRQEIEGHYRKLHKSFQANAYRALVTNAKNIAEALIPLKADLPPKQTFGETLKKIGDSKENQMAYPS